MDGWSLAVDFGTTFTTASIVSGDTATVLELDGSWKIPSAVALDDGGALVVGLASGDEAGWAPDRVERNPKRSLGRTRHLILAGRPIPVAGAVGALLRAIADEGIRRRNGVAPTRLVLTHPVRWSAARRAELAAAATGAGLPDPILVPEPVAAAMHYVDDSVREGDLVAVYDLGGGTFDTAVLRRGADGFALAGEPGGNADLGGERLDDLLYGFVGTRLAQVAPDVWEQMTSGSTPAGRRQAAEVRRDVRRAKEALSRQQHYTMHVTAAGLDLRITRPEFEALVAAPLRDTVDELAATIERAGVGRDEIARIYLVGGASRIPLVSRLVAERLGELPATFDDPKSAVVLGAATLVREAPTGPATPRAGVYSTAPETPPLGMSAVPAATGTAATTPRRRNGWIAPVVAAAVAALLVVGGVAFLAPSPAASTAPLPSPVVSPAPLPAAPVVLPPTTTVAPTTGARSPRSTAAPAPAPKKSATSKPSMPTSETCMDNCDSTMPEEDDTTDSGDSSGGYNSGYDSGGDTGSYDDYGYGYGY